MTTLNFPDNPTVGVLYNAANGLQYTYDGVKWTSNGVYSSALTFIQDGTEVVRTVQDKLKETLSVKDFGAVGNGSTDDTTAIQNAVNQLNTLSTSASATLVFPAGSYKITKPINFSQNASGNYRREIVGGDGTMAVARIVVAYHGYGSNLVSGNDKGGFYFGPATGSGNSNEFSLSGFYFEGMTGGFKHPPAIECNGPVQSRFNNIVIARLDNSGLSISSPQNCKFFNVSVWFCGRSFEYKDTGTQGASGTAKVVVNQAQNSTNVTLDTALSTFVNPFTDSDKFKTIALWSSSPANQFRQKCKITAKNSATDVTVDVQQPDLAEAVLTDKNLIFGSPHITTESNSTTITADANTFAADDVGAYIWLRVANPTTITAWNVNTNYSSAGTLVKNNGRIYRLLGNIGAGRLPPTHAKTKADIFAHAENEGITTTATSTWSSTRAYTTDELIVNAGKIYKAITNIAANNNSGPAAPTHTTPSTNASPGDQDVNGWEYVPWDEMRIGLYRRKITGFTSATTVTLNKAIGATTTTSNTPASEDITCEIAIPAIDINSDHGGGNSSDNKFVNLQVESHRGVGVCAEDQSLLDFATTKIHSEQGSNALLSSAVNYSIAALWLHQVDGTYNGSTDGQYIGDNRVYVSGQTAGFILNDFITRTANHEQIVAIDEKNGFFDGASLVIDNMTITGGIADDELKDVVNDLSGNPVGYIFNGAFINQGSDTSGPIVGHITQDAYVKQTGSDASLYLDKGNLILPDSTATTLGRLALGNSQDLQIFHDGNNSRIQDAGTGFLLLDTNTLMIRNVNGSKTMAKFVANGAAELYFDHGLKAKTLGSGFSVTGNLGVNTDSPSTPIHVVSSVARGITVERSNSNNANIEFKNTSSSMFCGLTTSGTGFSIDDDDNLAAASMLFVQRADGNVGIANDSPTEKLDVTGNIKASGSITASTGATFGGAVFNTDGDLDTTRAINISNAQPGIKFTDTGANPDFIIQNRDGSFAVRDTTSNANRFLVNMANGDVTVTGNIQKGDGTGNLNISADGIILKGADGSTLASFTEAGAAVSYFNNSARVETTNTGAKIYGNTGADPALEIKHSNINVEGEVIRIARVDSDFRYHSILASNSNNTTNNFIKFNVHDASSSHPYIAQLTQLYMDDDKVSLRFDGSEKLVTTSGGITVTGSVTTQDMNMSNLNGFANEVDNTKGSWSIQEGADDLFLINRVNGKKYKFNLTEIN